MAFDNRNFKLDETAPAAVAYGKAFNAFLRNAAPAATKNHVSSGSCDTKEKLLLIEQAKAIHGMSTLKIFLEFDSS
jgi:hypothetical protein